MIRRLRRAVRRGYYRLKGFPLYPLLDQLAPSERWPRQQLQALQDEKVRRLIAHAFETVPYYREAMTARRLQPADIRGVRDLPKLPVLRRQDIQQNASKLRSSAPAVGTPQCFKTGGTTGEPLKIWKDRHAIAWGNAAYYRSLGWAGYDIDRDRLAILFGGSLGAASRNTGFRDRWWDRTLRLPAFSITESSVSEYYRQLQQARPEFLKGYAGAVYMLATLLHSAGHEDVRFRSIFTTSEQLPPAQRRAIEETFKSRVFDYYGCVEINSIGYECEFHDGYHIPEEHVVVEVERDQSGGSAPDRGGALVVTDLDNYHMPLIRYRNGDAAAIEHAPCACGRTLRRIKPLLGRVADTLRRTDGTPVLGGIATYVFRETRSIREFRLIQEELRRCRLQFVGDNAEAELAGALSTLRQYLGEDMEFITERMQRAFRGLHRKSVT